MFILDFKALLPPLRNDFNYSCIEMQSVNH